MKQELKEKLLLLADKYEVKEFIMDDPIQFPHRYTDKADIEISGLIASWIATGNRKAIIKSGDRIDHELFLNAPYRYILSEEWRKYRGVTSSFYRYYSWNDFYILCQTLYAAYREHGDLESYLCHSLFRYAIGKIAIGVRTYQWDACFVRCFRSKENVYVSALDDS